MRLFFPEPEQEGRSERWYRLVGYLYQNNIHLLELRSTCRKKDNKKDLSKLPTFQVFHTITKTKLTSRQAVIKRVLVKI